MTSREKMDVNSIKQRDMEDFGKGLHPEVDGDKLRKKEKKNCKVQHFSRWKRKTEARSFSI